MSSNVRKQINYLLKITDKTGIIEHCLLDKPDYIEGYCVDDNARALQVCLRLKNNYPILEKVLPTYFNFLKSAFQNGQLQNDLNSDLTWQKNFEINGEHYGRTLAALGEVNDKKLFDQIYSSLNCQSSPYPRVSAQIICALKYRHSTDIKLWADSLVNQYLKENTNSWHWFESLISYDNARLPLALLTAYQVTKNSQYLQIALDSLDFLTELTFNTKLDCFIFPGNRGWFTKSGQRNIFDQQPLEAGSAVETYSLAFQITKNKKYYDLAQKSFAWYSGKNVLKANMIDSQSGGIYDGFNSQKVNQNQGAESILSYLLAYNALENFR
ncbi:MAG: hypothetical protein WC784_04295 [Candidatus Shapirobacteria bacterium]|jgi:hypothetical protein